jgi:hypothetical protein
METTRVQFYSTEYPEFIGMRITPYSMTARASHTVYMKKTVIWNVSP